MYLTLYIYLLSYLSCVIVWNVGKVEPLPLQNKHNYKTRPEANILRKVPNSVDNYINETLGMYFMNWFDCCDELVFIKSHSEKRILWR